MAGPATPRERDQGRVMTDYFREQCMEAYRAVDHVCIRGLLRQVTEAAAAQKAILALDKRLEQIREFWEIFVDERLADACLNGHNLERAAGQSAADDERHGAIHDLLAPLIG